MKSKTIIRLASVAVLLVVGWLVFQSFGQGKKEAADQTEKKVVIAATGGSPRPFSFEEDGKLTGHNIELIQAVFDRLPQYKLEITKTEFSSIFAGLQSGRFQIGVNNFAKNPEREQNYLFSDPIFKNSYVAIFKKGDQRGKDVSTWSDLAGLKTVGSSGVNSTTAIESYNKENPDNTIDLSYSSEDLNSQLLGVESGKFDFLIMDKPMFEYYQKEFGYDLVGKEVSGDLSSQLLGSPYSYFIIEKEDPQLVEDINRALKEVIADGTSKKINEKYFGQDYSPKEGEK